MLRGMADPMHYLVSASGQMSLPAAARKRWGLENGGPVEVLDLGRVVMVMPIGESARMLDELLPAEEHLKFVQNIDDPDLRTT